MLAVSRVMKMWGVPALTFPFVLTTWFLALAAYAFGQVEIAAPFVFVTWLFLLPRVDLQPQPHGPIGSGILTGS